MTQTERDSTPPEAHGPPLPRDLIFLASLWLAGSWLVSIGIHPPLHPTALTYAPGVRTMVLSITIGLVVAWPLLRLSQAPTGWPIRRTLLDLVTLLALTQVIVWPLRLVTTWGVDRTAAIALTIAAWTTLAAAFVALATGVGRARAGRRVASMAICCLLCVGGPAAGWGSAAWTEHRGVGTVWDGEFAAWLGPLVGVHALTGGQVRPITDDQWHGILAVVAAAATAWLVVVVMIGRHPPDSPRGD